MTGADFQPDSFWRSLRQLNAFRLFVAVFFAVAPLYSDRLSFIAPGPAVPMALLGGGYLAAALAFLAMLRAGRAGFDRQLRLHLFTDIAVIALYMHLGGGNESGLGLLLTVPMAAAGLQPHARQALLPPALASLAMLAEAGLADGDGGAYLRAALLSTGFFAVAGLSHILAKGTLGSAREARERAREAADLTRINAKVIQDLPYGILVLSGDGRVLQHNQQAEHLTGCDLAGDQPLAACHAGLARAWRDWLRGRGPDALVLPAADARRRLRCRLLGLASDRRDGAVVIIEDMSELEHEATRMKLAALGRLTANLAHEIRNPLSAIRHAAQLLAEDRGAEADAARLTRIIEDNVGRLDYLVEDVLSLSRRDRQAREAIRLADYLPDFVNQFQLGEAVAPGIIRLQVEADAVLAFDRLHLDQILWNLCRNACRYCSGRPGSVVLGAAAAGDAIHLDLYNDGPAVPAELRHRLFEPFFTTGQAGTGLGLYIARELAEANGGQLRCLEEAGGARFRLTAERAR